MARVKYPAVYCILNLINQKIYIGSSNDYIKRTWEHTRELRDNRHFNKHLAKAVKKYGFNNFKFFILEKLESNNLDLIISKEQYYIDLLKPDYNILPKAHSHLGAKRDQSCKDKLSSKNVENIIYQIDKNMKLIKVHVDGCNKAAKETNTNSNGLRNCLCGEAKTAGGFIWLKERKEV